jgi:hypothetical protein
MKTALATACAVFALGFAGVAFADGLVTATLAQPTASPTKLVAAGGVFRCEGTTCSSFATDNTASLDGCKQLARQIGPLASFAGPYKAFDEKKLAQCNAVAATPKAATTASR